MNIEEVRTYCLTLPGVTEDVPYGPDWLVFRIEGKIFLSSFGFTMREPRAVKRKGA